MREDIVTRLRGGYLNDESEIVDLMDGAADLIEHLQRERNYWKDKALLPPNAGGNS